MWVFRRSPWVLEAPALPLPCGVAWVRGGGWFWSSWIPGSLRAVLRCVPSLLCWGCWWGSNPWLSGMSWGSCGGREASLTCQTTLCGSGSSYTTTTTSSTTSTTAEQLGLLLLLLLLLAATAAATTRTITTTNFLILRRRRAGTTSTTAAVTRTTRTAATAAAAAATSCYCCCYY